MEGFNFSCIFIKEEYFNENTNLVEMLDPRDLEKQTQRKYVFLQFKHNGNNLLVPLRSEIPNLSYIGQVGYMAPTEGRPNAGLDYRKILIVNDIKYMETHTYLKIPASQAKIINNNFNSIKNQVIAYVDGYVKSANKNRHLRDKKFCFSTLHNFHTELGINPSRQAR